MKCAKSRRSVELQVPVLPILNDQPQYRSIRITSKQAGQLLNGFYRFEKVVRENPKGKYPWVIDPDTQEDLKQKIWVPAKAEQISELPFIIRLLDKTDYQELAIWSKKSGGCVMSGAMLKISQARV